MDASRPVTPETVRQHGISEEEYELIKKQLGREPNLNELGVFSVMWSEHCGYKNSRPLLRKLPTTGPAILQGPGENAGAVDIGNGYAIIFKIESHNHPSAVEPYQGAATGVGGILRDVFTMGARPIAMLNSLRFGSLDSKKTRRLFRGVVQGIGDYGNCVGVPTVAGEIYFDPVYQDNILVNAMCVGLARTDHIIRARASGEGNPVIYFGSTTGRDGIHGATFASEELSGEGEDKRPSVQVGDPFMEKLLMEATLELNEAGLLEGIQDMGAAGLTSSSSEMAHRAGTGIELSLDNIPKRAADLTPYEMLLSESQERMLAVAPPANLDRIMAILERWDLHGEVIGRVTGDSHLRVSYKGQQVADMPVAALTSEVPTYTRPVVLPPYLKQAQEMPAIQVEDYNRTFLEMIQHPDIASKAWVFQQYDYMVQTNTVLPPGQGGAAVVRIKDTNTGIAMTTDCNGGYCYLDPWQGAAIAVAEAARNLAACGARPLAVTNCLNFSNPEKSPIYYQLAKCLEGMGEACRVLETPVTGGNASLYNETDGRPIHPTPVIGMIGLLEDYRLAIGAGFRQAGDVIILVGECRDELGGSLLARMQTGRVCGPCPQIDLAAEKRHLDAVLHLNRERLLQSCSDVAEGGLLLTVAECAILGNKGATIEHSTALSPEAMLWGESQGRYILSCGSGDRDRVLALLQEAAVPCTVIGEVGGNMLQCNDHVRLPLRAARDMYLTAIEHALEDSHDAIL